MWKFGGLDGCEVKDEWGLLYMNMWELQVEAFGESKNKPSEFSFIFQESSVMKFLLQCKGYVFVQMGLATYKKKLKTKV